MRVNVYAEELPPENHIEITGKEINGHTFTGLRIPLYLPVTLPDGTQAQGKFMHHPDDDDSSAITIWGKRDLRVLLREAIAKLDSYYNGRQRIPMNTTQEPKYAVNSKTGKLYNIESGVSIPDDEPVFILRAKDLNAIATLQFYTRECSNEEHKAVIRARIHQFQQFAIHNPQLMKEPD